MRKWILGLAIVGVFAAAPMLGARHIELFVDDDAELGGNGSSKKPFRTLEEAVAAAPSSSNLVIINVAPGEYPLTQTLVIDRSMELRGSTMQHADGTQFASGDVDESTVSRLYAAGAGMVDLIRVEGANGAITTDVTIRGFVLESTSPMRTVLRMNRTQDFRVSDNVVRGAGAFGVQTAGSSGEITHNHFSALNTGGVISGGWAESPAHVVIRNNRMVQNNLGGLLLGGAAFEVNEAGDQLTADIRDNDLSDNAGNSQGFGVRILVLRRDPWITTDVDMSAARVTATVRGNSMTGNRLGVVIDAGFPYREYVRAPVTTTQCDARTFSGELELTFQGNHIEESSIAPAIVSLTRYTASLTPSQMPNWQYLNGASFTITDPDRDLKGYLKDHPASDPYLGPCAGDATNEALNNVFVYNGKVIRADDK